MASPVTALRGLNHVVGNARAHYFGGGVEPPVATESHVVHEARHATVRRYGRGTATGEPILLVPPLAVSIDCFDLRADQSLAGFLLGTGRPVYVVDYGAISFADRAMGLEDWFDDILPATIELVSTAHERRPVDIVTWSLGGTLSLLTAAAHPELPLRSIAAVATPIDYSRIGYLAGIRALGRLTGGNLVGAAAKAAGGMPAWAVRASFKATALQRELTKPWFVLRNLHDADTLGRMEAVDRFIDAMPGYPGRLYAQVYYRLVQANDLSRGRLRLGDRVIELADVCPAVLIVGGHSDVIAPIGSVRRALDVLTGARSLRMESAPGSHLGVLTGPEARETTWRYLADFLAEQVREGGHSAGSAG